MANGLSSRINSLCGRVKAIRADISVSRCGALAATTSDLPNQSVSENTRRLLEGENHCNDDNSSIGTIQQSSVAITTFGENVRLADVHFRLFHLILRMQGNQVFILHLQVGYKS